MGMQADAAGIAAVLVAISMYASAQTNTFPQDGPAGIGTTNPMTVLDVVGTQTYQNPSGGHYLLNYGLGGSLEDPNSGDIILLIPASTGAGVSGSQFSGVIRSDRGDGGAWNLNSEWYVSTQSAYTNNTGSILPLSGQQEYGSVPTLITCIYNGTTYIAFQTPAGNSFSRWSLTGNWSNNQNAQKPIMVAHSSVTNISTLVGYESLGSQISMTGIGSTSKVGIGTTTPGQLLQVGGSYAQNPTIQIGGSDSNNSSTGAYALLFGAWRDVEANVASGIVATPVWACCGGYPSGGYAGIRPNNLGFYTFYDFASPTNYSPQLYLSGTSGNVGIGTTSPQAKLEINGGLRFSGDAASVVQTTAWTGVLCGGDYAEAMNPKGGKHQYEPGDVLVLAADGKGAVAKSTESYSSLVAGIYATKPGVIGRRSTLLKDADELPMAMVGVVPTKVTSENGPIKLGDLLVTSSQPGYAMKGTDRARMLGAVIGKAMGSLDSGSGVIEVLVTLQ